MNFYSTTAFRLEVRAYPHILKTQSCALFKGFVTYSAQKNPGERFEHVPDEAKFLQSDHLSNWASRPRRFLFLFVKVIKWNTSDPEEI